MHEHRRRRRDTHLVVKRDVRREVGGEERGTGGERGVVGQRERPLRVDLDALRIAAGCARQREHTLAVELAGDLVAEHVRKLGRLRIETAANEDVGEVDAGRAHLDDASRGLGPVSRA